MKLLLTAVVCLGLAILVSATQSPDPVGQSAGYQSFEQVRTFDRAQEPTHGTVFLNAPAASVMNAGEPYPYGSVLIMEWRKGGKDGEIARLDVMRKEKGYGVAYGADRNGDWECVLFARRKIDHRCRAVARVREVSPQGGRVERFRVRRAIRDAEVAVQRGRTMPQRHRGTEKSFLNASVA